MAERPEDLNLPTAVITRIVKEAVPEGVNVSKDARLAISKAASVFILYATSCANNFAMKANRKTLSAQDVLNAMEDMEFERFVEPLKDSLDVFKKAQQGKKEASEKRKKAKEQTVTPGGDHDGDEQDAVVNDNEEEEDEADENEEENGSNEESADDQDSIEDS